MKSKTLPVPSLLIAFILAISVTSISCGNKDKDPNPTAQFSATINGESFLPTYANAFHEYEVINIYGIMPKATDSFQLSVSIPDTATVNTTLTAKNDDVYIRYVNFKGYTTYSSAARTGHATLTLTTIDKTNKRLAGNFSGVLYKQAADVDSLVITNGQFNISYN
ncbi:MAG: hypothetical protein ACJ751_16270 [Niastella sp.]|uniref:hypothetical protein n=1 Tax=Niastella sp. TaxID=1869183 RepID=UPI00389AE91A